jgi:hypothetical protein
MYSVIIPSRHDAPTGHPLLVFLESFAAHTTDEEKSKSEFLLKFDEDDAFIPSDEQLDSFGVTIKKFVWGRHGGRMSVHETTSCLYKYVDPACKFVQLGADDFVFNRDNFVTEILEHSDTYKIAGAPGGGGYKFLGERHWIPVGTEGYMPAFSTKILDSWSGYTGPHAESDGVAKDVASYLRDEYNYEVMFAPGGKECYYKRNEARDRTRPDGAVYNNTPFAWLSRPGSKPDLYSHPFTPRIGDEDMWRLLGDSIMRAILVDSIGGIKSLQNLVNKGERYR